MKGFLKVIYNIFRGLCRAAIKLPVTIIFLLIWLVTLEPGTNDRLTVRKAKRIRALSKFKLFVFNLFPEGFFKFIGYGGYKNYINSHLKNGLQLCSKGTN